MMKDDESQNGNVDKSLPKFVSRHVYYIETSQKVAHWRVEQITAIMPSECRIAVNS